MASACRTAFCVRVNTAFAARRDSRRANTDSTPSHVTIHERARSQRQHARRNRCEHVRRPPLARRLAEIAVSLAREPPSTPIHRPGSPMSMRLWQGMGAWRSGAHALTQPDRGDVSIIHKRCTAFHHSLLFLSSRTQSTLLHTCSYQLLIDLGRPFITNSLTSHSLRPFLILNNQTFLQHPPPSK